MSYQNLPKQVQDEMMRFQSLGEQLQMLAQQKFTYDTSIKEKELSIKELEELPDDVVVYKQVGGIMIKSDKAKVLEGLKDDKTTMEMRKKTLERNEASMKKNFDEMKESLQKKLGGNLD